MTFDIILGILLSVFIINGIKKGAISMVFRFCSFLLSIFLMPYVNPIIEKILVGKSKIVIYIVSFVVLYTFLNFLAYFIEKFIDSVHLGGINKLIGAILGAIIAFSISFLLIVVMLFFPKSEKVQNILDTSYAVYYISINTKSFNKYFPEKIEKKLDDLNMKNQNIKLKQEIYNNIKKGVNSNEN